MKKILLISVAILTLGVLSGCKEWLSIPSPTQMDSQTVFQDLDAAEMAVLGVYNAAINRSLWYEFGVNSDDAMTAEDGNNSRTRPANFEYVLSEITESAYTAMYSAIERANSIIKKLPSYTPANAAEQKRKDMLMGECLALRAQCYLHLVRLYGDVPYTVVPFEDAASFSLGRTDRDVIYDACIADLQQAVELLPWKSEGMVPTYERVTKNAAYGMLARMALYAAGYSLRWDTDTYSASSLRMAKRSDTGRIAELYRIASDACEAVIRKGENRLLDSFEQIFRDLINNRYNAETMFEHGHLGPNSTNYNPTSNGYTNGIGIMRGNALFGRSYPMQRAMPTLWFDYAAGDERRGVTICNYGIDVDGNHHLHPYTIATIGKYRANWYESARVSDSERSTNWIWLRYSDVLLMYAEAQNEINNGPTAAATDALRQVRTRAFGGDASKIGAIPSSYEDFRNAIIQERKLELAFEGWRKTDLARFGVLYEVLTEEKAKLIDLANRAGRYASVPRFAAYDATTPAQLGDPLVEMTPAYTYATDPGTVAGYRVVDLNGNGTTNPSGIGNFFGLFFDATSGNLSAWVANMNSGLKKNQSELYPFKQVIMDNNPGLDGQQLPGY